MSLMRWDPFRDLEDFSRSMNRLFARSTPSTTGGREAMIAADWAPAVDISETPEEYLVKAELPEVKKEDVKVKVEHGLLRIEGERKIEKEEKGKKLHRVERAYGSFVRTFALPDDVDEANVRAEVKDGVLAVHLMKSAKAKPRSIDVKVG